MTKEKYQDIYLRSMVYIHNNENVSYDDFWKFVSQFDISRLTAVKLIDELVNSGAVIYRDETLSMRV